MNAFYEAASPTTLASLLCDLEAIGELTPAQTAMHSEVRAVLIANVGADEANQLCNAMAH